jgi:hypothetical protein
MVGGDDGTSVLLPMTLVFMPSEESEQEISENGYCKRHCNNFIFHVNELLRELIYFSTCRHIIMIVTFLFVF